MKPEGVLFRQEPLLPRSRNVVAAGIGLDAFVDDGGVGVVVDVVAVDPFVVGYTLLDVLEIAKICDVRMRLCVLGLEPGKSFVNQFLCWYIEIQQILREFAFMTNLCRGIKLPGRLQVPVSFLDISSMYVPASDVCFCRKDDS